MKWLKRILLVIVLLYAFSGIANLLYVEDTPVEPVEAEEIVLPRATEVSDIDEDILLAATNAHRKKHGLKPLKISKALQASAQDKCRDMVERNYWKHKTPDGAEPWEFMKKYTSYSGAGENLAFGQKNAQEVVGDWIKSPGHNKNLLDTSYDLVGFGVCKGDTYIDGGPHVITVQHFINI